MIRECTDVLFVPNEHSEQKELQPLRYVAVRIRRRQGDLLEEAVEDRHFAVLTNIRVWKASLIGNSPRFCVEYAGIVASRTIRIEITGDLIAFLRPMFYNRELNMGLSD